MARSPEVQDARVSMGVQAIRYAVAKAASLPLPTETPRPESEGWQRAEQLNKEDYGIIIAYMHANKGDSLHVIGRTFLSPIFGRREIFLPNAMHRHRDWYGHAGDTIHLQVFPIFTPETRRSAQEDPALAKRLKSKYRIDITDPKLLRIIAHHTKQYINQAILLLQRAGVGIVAPQGHREETLTTMTTAIESIVKRAQQQDIHNIAVLFVGYDIKGVQDYGHKKNENYNFFRTHRFHDGKCITLDELNKEAGGNLRKLNEIIRREMQVTVPAEYLPKP